MMCPYDDNEDNEDASADDWLQHHTSSPDEVEHCSHLTDAITCRPPCVWDAPRGMDGTCKPLPKKMSAHTYMCAAETSQDRPSAACQAHHTISEYQQTNCATLTGNDGEDCRSAGCTWSFDDATRAYACTGTLAPRMVTRSPSCRQGAARTASKRNACLETCMRTPENYCQSVCHSTGCTESCYRHHMGSLQQWKGMPQCNSTLHLQRNPEYHEWKAECSQHMQGQCINTKFNKDCTISKEEGTCSANAKCVWTQDTCVARPVITSISAAVPSTDHPTLQQQSISISPRLLQAPDVTCSAPDHAWSQPVLYSEPSNGVPNEYYCTHQYVGQDSPVSYTHLTLPTKA